MDVLIIRTYATLTLRKEYKSLFTLSCSSFEINYSQVRIQLLPNFLEPPEIAVPKVGTLPKLVQKQLH